MPIGWNEIKDRAIAFTRKWSGETSEHAEAKSFWDDFFHIYGRDRKTLAAFEAPVKKLSGEWGFIDLFWKGMLLVEHKSAGKDLDKAHSQAIDYIQGLVSTGRGDEVPRYLLVSDFARFALHDLEDGTQITFPLGQLYHHVHAFGFIAGYRSHSFKPDDPLNIHAAEIMGELHDTLAAGGYAGHPLERFLVRVLFCLFAEDNGIFEPQAFTRYLETRTAADGSDLGIHLQHWFGVLNQPAERRQKNLPEELRALPYVNGGLFEETLEIAACNSDMRLALLRATNFNWSRISPAVFGSLFQSVMLPKERRQIGAHYTSERDILKVVRSLFLDDLRAELETAKADTSTRRKSRLTALHERLGTLRFLDPACGCGNFLVLTYRELRLLEIDLLLALHTGAAGMKQAVLDLDHLSRVDVDQFYGIEISEWPARIAEVALWLMDHQMNLTLSETFGEYYVRLPLRKSATIACANALRIDWRDVLPPEQCAYILGNPPFVGKKEQNPGQKADMELVWKGVSGTGILDYVTCWYRKALEYAQAAQTRIAFVSTNSIAQGEQVGVFWPELRRLATFYIFFAHRTFSWISEARGKAHVHVVIIGLTFQNPDIRFIFDYEDIGADPTLISTKLNINPYLVQAPDIAITRRSKPINGAPSISYGSMANDSKKSDGTLGNFILDAEDRRVLLNESPGLEPYIRLFVGTNEFVNGIQRWCLWLAGIPPQIIRSSATLLKRIENVRKIRQESSRPATQKLAMTPTLFGEIRQPNTRYLLIPKVSSERRRYIPIGFLPPEVIASGSALVISDASLYDFGVIASSIHMAWMRCVGGRLKSDYQYSNTIVYNNFPWPEGADEKQRARVEAGAQAVLDARAKYPASSLADLYDPLTMPPELVKAHADLDKAVDRCYRVAAFKDDRERVEHLFALYEQLTAPLAPSPSTGKRRKS